ncbi:MAG: PKD domain-containing protein [Saprospiraceae bacterium]|nr:PKD domain-containing protein [Saprospiraceae bacterium]
MTLTHKTLILIIFSCSTIVLSQKSKMIIPNLNGMEFSANKGSEIFSTPSSGTLLPSLIKDDWNVVLKNFSTFSHNEAISKADHKILKDAANAVRKQANPSINQTVNNTRNNVVPPKLLNNFRGNIRDNSIPMDNSMAVSRNGFIVSAINSNIIFTRPDGLVTFRKGDADFFKLLGLGTRMSDPRIIYDAVENKFIIMFQHGSEPSNSYICIAFSKTEDPNGEWSYFKIKSNPSGDDVWFDFPNLSISDKDFYISGNMFSSEDVFQYSVIFQIDKTTGYDGKAIDWKYYKNLRGVNNERIFNPVPVESGWKNHVNPGMYFISNNPWGGGNNYHFNYTTASLYNNPELMTLLIVGPEMTYPPDARQKDINTLLDTGGARIRSAIHLDGTIHFGAHVGTIGGDVGIFYGRLNVQDLIMTSTILTDVGKDYAYPTFTSFGSSETDDDILMNYVFSGPQLYGSQAQRICKGKNDIFEWSDETILKAGLTAIGSPSDISTRWGDYTAASRRYLDNRIESWVAGSYGETRNHSNWLGQLVSESDFSSRPLAEFVSDKTTTPKDSIITFNDITYKDATAWTWTFENGIPATSTEKNPVVVWTENGSYDVKLVVTTDLGTDSITKIDYIHILDPIQKPVASFIFDRDTILIGDSIAFTNLSSDNSIRYKWTFQSGTPATSLLTNPVITYNKTGTFLVSLTAENSVGTHTKVISKAITVLSKEAPKVNFASDKTNINIGDSILFSDLSTGSPNKWNWLFNGGKPEASFIKNPTITYDSAGVFEVKLKVSNFNGSDSVQKLSYVSVGQVATKDFPFLENISLYPNPVSIDKVTIDFDLTNTQKLNFKLFNSTGSLVKVLYNDKVKQGKNQFSFQTAMLNNGPYFIQISDGLKNSRSLSFIVSH